MSALIFAIVGFLLQALTLKVALGLLGQSSAENKYSRAIGVAMLLAVAGWVLGLAPFGVGYLLYPLLWLAVIMGVYGIGFFRSLGVALLQVGVKIVIGIVLSLIGFSSATLLG